MFITSICIHNQEKATCEKCKAEGSKTWNDHAEDLLKNFPGVDRAELLKTMVALALMDTRYGNKREERAACDFLNLVQSEAVKQLQKK